jgi:TolB-like protein
MTSGLHFPHQQLIFPFLSDLGLPMRRPIRKDGSLRYFFEEYAFDTDRRELHRGADVVCIAPQVFDLLDYLIRNRERVVSRDDLIKAIWNGRCVSDAALTTRLNVARTAIGDSGCQQRLIKTLPRKGFRFVASVREEQGPEATDCTADSSRPVLALPDGASIAVLPFTNLSSDPDQEYFADGMVNDITTALARFKFLFVIARNSSFAYKGRAVDIKQIGRELGVRYAIEGCVRRAGEKVRITVQLIDALSGVHLWADRYEGNLNDIFALQDEITVNIVSAIHPKLLRTEIELAARRRSNDLSAYDLCLRARHHINAMTRQGMVEAIQLCQRALEVDPRYGVAAMLESLAWTLNVSQGWAVEPKSEAAEAARLLQLALSIDENDPEALAGVGRLTAHLVGDFNAAAEMVDRAVALNPNSFWAWYQRGLTCTSAGRLEEAVLSLERAIRLNPLDPLIFMTYVGLGIAFIGLGRFDNAVEAAKRALRGNQRCPGAYRCLAAALAHLGRNAEAREAVAALLEVQPDFRISRWNVPARWRPQMYVDGLRKAGFPD